MYQELFSIWEYNGKFNSPFSYVANTPVNETISKLIHRHHIYVYYIYYLFSLYIYVCIYIKQVISSAKK